MPFFPRVDVALVGLGGRVAQRVAVQPDPGVLLQPMPQVQQVHPVAAQLAGQLRRRHTLGDAAEDQDDLRRPPLDALQGGPGPGVEDAAAVAALVVHDGVAVPSVDAEAVGGAAAGAGQAAGVEHGQKLGVAGALIHQVGEREVHGGGIPSVRGNHRIPPPPGAIVKGPGTGLAS
jgi:hypothetical protein